MAKLPPILTRTYILNTYNQVDIFSRYISKYTDTKLEVSDIIYLIKYNKKYNSPFREDIYPSVGFKYNGRTGDINISTDYNLYGKLTMRDFVACRGSISSVFWGDCFDLVAYITKKKINNPKEFNDILLHIYITMSGDIVDSSIEVLKVQNVTRDKTKIEVSIREWNYHDAIFWEKYHVSLPYLKSQKDVKVFPIDYYWINGELINYEYHKSDPCYCYFSGTDNNGIDNIQLYFPYRIRNANVPRFISNNNGIINPYNLKDGDSIVVIKSAKDAIILGFLHHYIYRANSNLTILALHSETTYLKDKVGTYLSERYKYKYIHADYDLSGIACMNYHKRKFGFVPLYLKGIEGVKDISDYINKLGIESSINLINKTIHGTTTVIK